MPYVKRDIAGTIVGVFQQPQRDAAEKLATNARDLARWNRWRDRSLAQVQAAASVEIARQAEALRASITRVGPVKARVQDSRLREAERALANHDATNPPAVGQYLLLESYVPKRGADPLAVAAWVTQTAAAWIQAASQIEIAEEAALDAVVAAADIAAVEAVLDGLNWPDLSALRGGA